MTTASLVVAIIAAVLVMGANIVPLQLRGGAAVAASVSALALVPADLFTQLPDPWDSIAGLALSTLVSAAGYIYARRSPRLLRHTWPLFVALTLPIFTSFEPDRDPRFAIAIVITLLTQAGLMGTLSRSEWSIVSRTVMWLAVPISLMCLYEAFVARAPLFATSEYGPNFLFPDTIRAQATLGHPIVAGFYLAFAACLALGTKQWRLLPRLAFVCLTVAGVVATGSSSPFAVCLLGLGICAVLGVNGSGRRVYAGIWLAVVVALTWQWIFSASLTGDISGRNAVHRLNSLRAFPRLLDQPFPQTLIGNGYDSVRDLFESGYFVNDGFFTVDNQYVSTLANAGLIGLTLLMVFMAGVLWRSRNRTWPLIVLFALMATSFDVLEWALPISLLLLGTALSTEAHRSCAEVDRDDRQVSSKQERESSRVASIRSLESIYGTPH